MNQQGNKMAKKGNDSFVDFNIEINVNDISTPIVQEMVKKTQYIFIYSSTCVSTRFTKKRSKNYNLLPTMILIS